MLVWELLTEEQDVLLGVPEDFNLTVGIIGDSEERSVSIVFDFQHGSPNE